MSEPLITIEYSHYLKLQRTQAQLRCEILIGIRNYIANYPEVKTKHELLQLIRSLENNYQNVVDNMKEGEQNE